MKEKIKKLISKIKAKRKKTIYYWKKQYRITKKELKEEQKRNDILSFDLRKTYAKSKYYQNKYIFTLNLYRNLKKKKGGNKK